MKIKRYSNILTVLGLVLIWISENGGQELNKLSPSETLAQYDLLFNGVDLNNWHAYRLTAVTDAWSVKTNLPLGPRIENGNGNKLPILTNKKFKNFDLKIDFQVTPGGNSGIFTRYEEVALDAGNARSGPELQICGPSHPDCAGPTKHPGSSYDMFGVNPTIRTTWYNPPGSWNQIRIVVFDSNYVHYGNGKKLLEYKIGTAEYIKAYNASKYASDGNNGRYYDIHPGGILLQHHGEIGMTFRNIRAKELTVHPFKREFPGGVWPDSLSQDFVFGSSSTSAMMGFAAKELDLSIEYGAAGHTLIKIPLAHSDFQAMETNGRSVPFQKISEGTYSLTRPGGNCGLVIVRARVNGNLRTKIIQLQ